MRLSKNMNKFEVKSDFTEYKNLFLEENSKLNLISKNDEQYLYEKHIYDSLSIKLFFEKYALSDKLLTILDIGCGGGFPCVPLSIEYPNMNVIGIDSIRKKINSINVIKEKLKLDNLTTICDRVENIKDKKFDIVLSRAVADMAKICGYALPLMKRNGYFIAYKSKKVQDEINAAKSILKKYNAKIVDIIEYSLPLEEKYERNLVVISLLS